MNDNCRPRPPQLKPQQLSAPVSIGWASAHVPAIRRENVEAAWPHASGSGCSCLLFGPLTSVWQGPSRTFMLDIAYALSSNLNMAYFRMIEPFATRFYFSKHLRVQGKDEY